MDSDHRIALFLQELTASAENWRDWRWQMQHRIRTAAGLRNWIKVSPGEEASIASVAGRYSWTVTPYYASLMDPEDPACPIRRQALPSSDEMSRLPGVAEDPVGDRSFRVTNRVIHKYVDRAVILVTSHCPVLCRYCTRKHHTTAEGSSYFEQGEGASWEPDFEYIQRTTSIRDVLLTGGDPLSYGDARLEKILQRLRQIPHVEIIRFGTRYPVLLPQRITTDFCQMVARYHPIWFNTHFNHPRELTVEAIGACDLLQRYGVPVGNQSVLLRGINDDVPTMLSLCRLLVKARIRPYYLYHCDAVEGVGHFQTSIEQGRQIMRGLVGHTTGFAVPQYVVATKKGKVLLSEDNVVEIEPSRAILRSYDGTTVEVPSAGPTTAPC